MKLKTWLLVQLDMKQYREIIIMEGNFMFITGVIMVYLMIHNLYIHNLLIQLFMH